MLFPVVQHLGQDLLSAVGLRFPDRGPKYGYEVFHLRFGQACIHGRSKVETKLPPGARHVGEGGDGGQLPVLVAENITNEDVGKQVLFKEPIHNG